MQGQETVPNKIDRLGSVESLLNLMGIYCTKIVIGKPKNKKCAKKTFARRISNYK